MQTNQTSETGAEQTRLQEDREGRAPWKKWGPYGIRSLSRYHAVHPYVFNAGGQEYRVGYVPGDSDSGMFGGNSNWRGPIWMPKQLERTAGRCDQRAFKRPQIFRNRPAPLEKRLS